MRIIPLLLLLWIVLNYSLLRFILPSIHNALVLPDAAGVVFRTCDNRVSFVVKSTREDLVFVTVENLELVASVSRPDPARLIATSCDNLVALRVE